MKKAMLLIVTFIMFSCSSSDSETSSSNTDTKINLPSWLVSGTYKAENVNTRFPYPTTNPYSMRFKDSNIFIKGKSSSSSEEDLQNIINNFEASNRLVSVDESQKVDENGFNHYKIRIVYKPTDSSQTSNDSMSFEIIAVTVLSNTLQIIYAGNSGGGTLGDTQYYILQK